MTRQVRVQELAGRRVRDANGKIAGRIMSIQASIDGGECVVEEYHLGAAALLERLGISAARLVGVPMKREPLRVPWRKMDLSDPRKPRLVCAVEEL